MSQAFRLIALLPYCPIALLRPGTRHLGPRTRSTPRTGHRTQYPVLGTRYRIALLPYCPIALLPYCLFALLPPCPTAINESPRDRCRRLHRLAGL
jgi:hypothetical protein